MYVTDRVIDAVCKLDYPLEKLQIQVLDDSTDETCDIARLAVHRMQGRGFDICVPPPDGPPWFQGGCARRRSEDWPRASSSRSSTRTSSRPRDFLRRTVPYFTVDDKLAVVQARWGHLNDDYSMLTRVQAILLDGHFVLEHGGRNRAGCFFNFNGTSGVWRKDRDRRRRRLAARHADRRPRLSATARSCAAGSSCSCPIW